MEAPLLHEASRLLKQFRRINAVKNATKDQFKLKSKSATAIKEIHDTISLFLRDWAEDDECQGLLQHLTDNLHDLRFNFFTLTKLSKPLLNKIKRFQDAHCGHHRANG